MTWQPIETAPKDGREILCTWVYVMRDGSWHWSNVMHVLSWFPDWHGKGIGSWVLDGDFGIRFEPDGVHETPPVGNWEPTHWMPLPEPPQVDPAVDPVGDAPAAQADHAR